MSTKGEAYNSMRESVQGAETERKQMQELQEEMHCIKEISKENRDVSVEQLE